MIRYYKIILVLFVVAIGTSLLYQYVNKERIFEFRIRNAIENYDVEILLKYYDVLLENNFEVNDAVIILVDYYSKTKNTNILYSIIDKYFASGFFNENLSYNLIKILYDNSLYSNAAYIYNKLLELYPDNRFIKISIARMLAFSGRFEESVLEYKNFLGGEK